MSSDQSDDGRGEELDSLEADLKEMLAPQSTEGSGGSEARPLVDFEESVEIGAFEIDEEIGRGGMASVYRGKHRATGVPIALKVIDGTIDGDVRRRFHAEVQAHASLLHPGIVYLFEYGEVGPRAETASGERLREGSPYVAMECADGGTLRNAMPIQGWSSLRRLLVQALDALAYAHARGVVHRDLKPENLLWFEGERPSEQHGRLKLADFGIAHAYEEEDARETDVLSSPIGTPLYMAPEQFRGGWREYGPWTDLYALGCIAWELVCGRPPFTAMEMNFVELSMHHAEAARPPLEPRFPVPTELEGWIHRCMATAPEHRFRRAADALWNLPEEPGDSQPPTATSNGSAGPSERGEESLAPESVGPTFGSTGLLGRTLPDDGVERSARRPDPDARSRPDRTPGAEPAAKDSLPPIPASPRRDETTSLPTPLVGAGLGLFDLREPPFVDRNTERERIWRAVRESATERTFRAVFITGESGTGKSRLAEWVVTRAHEVGAARTIRAKHTAAGSVRQGLRSALERTLRTLKLDRDEVLEHLLETLPQLEGDDDLRRPDARALTEYLRPRETNAEDETMHYQFSSVGQKRALLVRLLRRLSKRRPVLLWLDDLQWGPEARGLLGHLREEVDRPPPLCVVATVRSDLFAEHDGLRNRLDAMAETPFSASIDLEPLERSHQRQLLHELLPLREELVDDVVKRTEGHPLFAMQLLGHWIDRGVIEVGEPGFQLSGESTREIPRDIHELWEYRIDRVLETVEPAKRKDLAEGLELAAALGRRVETREWRAVLELASVDVPRESVKRLVEHGLALRNEQGWAFRHVLLVETLESRARSRNRWSLHHRRCTRMLEQLYPHRPRSTARRRADHSIEGGRPAEALEPLMEAMHRTRGLADATNGRRLLERRRELLDRLDVPPDDPRRVANDIWMIRSGAKVGVPLEEVRADLLDLEPRIDRMEHGRIEALYHMSRSWCLDRLGRFEEAAELAERAVDHARPAGAPGTLSRALDRLGWCQGFASDLERACETFRKGVEAARRAADRMQALDLTVSLAWATASLGDTDDARRLYREALAEAEELGYPGVELRARNGLGELALLRGDVESARRNFTEYRRLVKELNRPADTAIACLNLAQVELLARRPDEAEAYVESARNHLAESGRTGKYDHLRRLVRLALAAAHEDWARFDAEFEPYRGGWPDRTDVVKDYAWLLELAGEYAAERDRERRARGAWRLSRSLWNDLQNDRADRLAARLDD